MACSQSQSRVSKISHEYPKSVQKVHIKFALSFPSNQVHKILFRCSKHCWAMGPSLSYIWWWWRQDVTVIYFFHGIIIHFDYFALHLDFVFGCGLKSLWRGDLTGLNWVLALTWIPFLTWIIICSDYLPCALLSLLAAVWSRLDWMTWLASTGPLVWLGFLLFFDYFAVPSRFEFVSHASTCIARVWSSLLILTSTQLDSTCSWFANSASPCSLFLRCCCLLLCFFLLFSISTTGGPTAIFYRKKSQIVLVLGLFLMCRARVLQENWEVWGNKNWEEGKKEWLSECRNRLWYMDNAIKITVPWGMIAVWILVQSGRS
jgi:hypothetical protein